jgi:ferredoxin
MNVRILRSECCGTALCVEIAPEVFALDSKQRAVVLDGEAAPSERVIEAAESCPCGAIVIDDDAIEDSAFDEVIEDDSIEADPIERDAIEGNSGEPADA